MADLTPEEEAADDTLADAIMAAWEGKPKPIPGPIERPEPEPVDLNRLVIETDADLSVLSDPVRHQGLLREFAKQIWEAGFEAAVGQCCGCSLDQAVLNPFDPREPTMADLTPWETEQITRAFGYVPEPEPLEAMLALVTKIKSDALSVVAKVAAERECARQEKRELEERYRAETAGLRAAIDAVRKLGAAAEEDVAPGSDYYYEYAVPVRIIKKTLEDHNV